MDRALPGGASIRSGIASLYGIAEFDDLPRGQRVRALCLASGYPGWDDLAYLLFAVGGLALSRRGPPSRAVLICVMFLVPICISSLFSGTQPTLANGAFLDALLYWLRFSVTFV